MPVLHPLSSGYYLGRVFLSLMLFDYDLVPGLSKVELFDGHNVVPRVDNVCWQDVPLGAGKHMHAYSDSWWYLCHVAVARWKHEAQYRSVGFAPCSNNTRQTPMWFLHLYND